MISHTQAYQKFRDQGIELLDYSVLLAFALPALEEKICSLTGPISTKTLKPFYFADPQMTVERLKFRLSKAEENFGREILMSSFSYFDAFFTDLLKEIIAFHGGERELIQKSKHHILDMDAQGRAKANDSRKKMMEYPKPVLLAKYQKHTKVLKTAGYPFASVRMSALGWKTLQLKLKWLKSSEFTEILRDGLLFPMEDKEVTKFTSLRKKRNDIAHGKATKYRARQAIDDAIWLRDLAVKIDRHVVENYFVIELYEP